MKDEKELIKRQHIYKVFLMGTEWFYINDDDKEIGPFSPRIIKVLVVDGTIEADTLLWRDGLEEWVEAREVNGLKEFLESRPRTPSPRRPSNSSSKNQFCSNCGAAVNSGAAVCLACGAAAQSSVIAGSRSGDSVYPSDPPKDPLLMALLSGCCIAGLGHMVLGQTIKGVMVLIGTILITLATAGVAAFILWPMSGLDAYLIAKKLKNGRRVGQWECF